MRPYQYIAILYATLLATLLVLYIVGFITIIWPVLLTVLYLLVLYFGVTQIQWNYYLPSRNKGNKPRQIAITFDDGPNAETAAILDILKKEHVPAAFFCIGMNIEANQAWAQRMHDEGHIVGNHSYYHTHSFDWMSTVNMLNEIEACNAIIRQVTGATPNLIRPPYGITNPNLARAVKRAGMISIGWSLRSFDTMAKDGNKLKTRIINKISDGDIVLLHDSMPITREILTDLIHEARKKGFTFVRVDQLLDIEAYT